MSVEITPRFFRSDSDTWGTRVIARLDWGLFAASLLLALLGIVFIYSATAHGGHGQSFVLRQSLALLAGVAGMAFLMALPYQVLQTYAKHIFLISLVLLVAVLVIGVRLRGSKSWFYFYWFYFQPVEVTRLALVVAVAAYADLRVREMRDVQTLFVPFILLGLHLGLILRQPDLSSALVLTPMTLAVLYVAGARVSALLALVGVGALALGIPLASTYFQLAGHRGGTSFLGRILRRAFLERAAFWELWAGVCALLCAGWWFLRKWRVFVPAVYLFSSLAVVAAGVGGSFVVRNALKDYQRKRLIAFVDPSLDPLGAGYNILQSEIAIGSGRFFGKGYLSGSQTQLGFLPEKHTDFIFSLVAEEVGFLGALFILALYFWVAWRAFDIAGEARDRFGRFLAAGLGTFFAFAGLVNIGMVMGLMPVTGLPLPFLSYGGSSMVGTFLSVGVLQSIYLRRYIL
jgi:rod shape determining protein RodA